VDSTVDINRSTEGVIREAVERLADLGVVVNHLPIKWLVPFHGDEVGEILTAANKVFIVGFGVTVAAK